MQVIHWDKESAMICKWSRPSSTSQSDSCSICSQASSLEFGWVLESSWNLTNTDFDYDNLMATMEMSRKRYAQCNIALIVSRDGRDWYIRNILQNQVLPLMMMILFWRSNKHLGAAVSRSHYLTWCKESYWDSLNKEDPPGTVTPTRSCALILFIQ